MKKLSVILFSVLLTGFFVTSVVHAGDYRGGQKPGGGKAPGPPPKPAPPPKGTEITETDMGDGLIGTKEVVNPPEDENSNDKKKLPEPDPAGPHRAPSHTWEPGDPFGGDGGDYQASLGKKHPVVFASYTPPSDYSSGTVFVEPTKEWWDKQNEGLGGNPPPAPKKPKDREDIMEMMNVIQANVGQDKTAELSSTLPRTEVNVELPVSQPSVCTTPVTDINQPLISPAGPLPIQPAFSQGQLQSSVYNFSPKHREKLLKKDIWKLRDRDL